MQTRPDGDLRQILLTAARGRAPRMVSQPWAASARQLLATREWHRTVQAIRRQAKLGGDARKQRRPPADEVIVDELIASCPPQALRLSPAVGAVALTVVRGGDYRCLDHLALALYEAGRDLPLPSTSMLHERLQRLTRMLGVSLSDSGRPEGGWRGIRTGAFRRLETILPSEMAEPDIFAWKVAQDQVAQFRQYTASEEEPYVLFRISVDDGGLAVPDAFPGGPLTSWARAFGLWFLHDVTRFVVAPSYVTFKAEVATTGGPIGTVQLNQIPHDEVRDNQPFMELVPELSPFLARTQVRAESARRHRQPRRGSAALLTYGVAIGPDRDEPEGPTAEQAVLRLSTTGCRFATHLDALPELPYPTSAGEHLQGDGLHAIRTAVLEVLVSRCLAVLPRR
jgi:hypothetical protein